jgi:ribosome assembly protein 1
MMGRDLVDIAEAPAGAVVGIAGLEHHVLKTVTLSSTAECPSLGLMSMAVKPIVRVVLDCTNIADMPKLKQGMKLLNQVCPRPAPSRCQPASSLYLPADAACRSR